MSCGRRELLTSACAVCGQPVKGGEGLLHLSFEEIYGVHHGECRERFERAVEEAVMRLRWRREMTRPQESLGASAKRPA